MKRIFHLCCLLAAISFLHSCVPSNRLYYFHNQVPSVDSSADSLRLASQVTIQRGDRLSITVSCQDPIQTAFLNPFNTQNSGSAAQVPGMGYLVDNAGKIDFPLLGRIKLLGLTSYQAADTVKALLSHYYKDPYVYVNVPGKVFFINGRTGSSVPMLNERLTIFEAISQAGMQDYFERKHKIWVVREEGGVRSYARVNLNDKSIFKSPFYYLHNNDLVYVEPGKLSTFFSANSPSRNILAVIASALAILLAISR